MADNDPAAPPPPASPPPSPTPADMKRPRDDEEDGNEGSTNTDDSTNAAAPSPTAGPTGPRGGSSSAPTSPKRPRRQPPQLIIFDWSAEDWLQGDTSANDQDPPRPGAPTAAGAADADPTTTTPADAAFRDILNILYDDDAPTLLTGMGAGPQQHDAGTQTGDAGDDDEDCDDDESPPDLDDGGSYGIDGYGEGDGDSDDDAEGDVVDYDDYGEPVYRRRTPPPPPKTFCELDRSIETLDDLIAVGQLRDAPDYFTKKYSVNIDGLHKMIPALREFQEMIGLDTIKRQVVDQIVYLSGKDNHQQFAALAAEAEAKRAREAARKAARQAGGGQSRSSSLLAQLFDGLGGGGGRKAAGSQYRMTDSVTKDDVSCDMFHTVIYGPPGVGKTVFAKLLARLFLNLGVTQNDTFRVARRSDLVGEYVGHTATKTQKVIDEAMGGVLFIDEVYALGNGGTTSGVGDGRVDSFSNECINTLNQNLTERKGEFICIVAGYKKETEKYFFDLNPGLKRRFSFYYNIDAYSWEELTRILMYKIGKLDGWSCAPRLGDSLLNDGFLRDKMKYFPHFAGDVETWLLNVKISHCKRVFGKAAEVQRVLTRADVEAGYQRYVDQKFNNDEQRKMEEEMIRNLYS